jgi:phosphate transport system substrate-binding protein
MNRRVHRVHLALLLAAGAPFPGHLEAQTVHVRAEVPEALPHYQPSVMVRGPLEIPCADALSDLGDEWDRSFRTFQPGASLACRYMLSKEAVKAFADGTTPLIIISRDLLPEELKGFQGKYGYPPTRIPICMDANIVFVNKANPLSAISMEQLDAIYSSRRLGGARATAWVWGDLGVKGELAQQTIHAYSWPEGAAIRGSFSTLALLGGEFRTGILDRVDSTALAEAVSLDAAGIAYGSIASWFAINKTLPLVPYQGTQPYSANDERYPMRRLFHAFLNRPPGKPVDPSVFEALHFLLSKEGQTEVAAVGLLPGPVEFLLAAGRRLNQAAVKD